MDVYVLIKVEGYSKGMFLLFCIGTAITFAVTPQAAQVEAEHWFVAMIITQVGVMLSQHWNKGKNWKKE